MSLGAAEQLLVRSPCRASDHESAAGLPATPWISGLQRRVAPELEIDVDSPDILPNVLCEDTADQIAILSQNDQAREEGAVAQLALLHWLQLDCSQAALE
jgi:hypothetical protein